MATEKVPYSSEEERQRIISEKTAEGLYLIEDHVGKQGNWLMFSDNALPNEPGTNIEKIDKLDKKIDALERRLEKLEKNKP